jgi:hypothetical protein
MTSSNYVLSLGDRFSAEYAPEQLLSRIEVSAPYLALREVQVDADHVVSATVDREYAMGLEAGVISVAEAGRHLAILGSLAAASQQPTDERHFYLAHRAHIVSFPAQADRDQSGYALRAVARAQLQRRAATAETRLTLPNGDPLFAMTVHYKMLSDRIFRRLMPFTNDFDSMPIPVRDAPVLTPDDVRRHSDNEVRAELTVDARDCAGHFAGCPALPVAKLMHALALLSGATLRPNDSRSHAATYVALQAEIGADQLAFAGQRLELRAVLESRNDQTAMTRVVALGPAQERIGSALFTMQPLTVD